MQLRTRAEWGARDPHHVDVVVPGSSRAVIAHHSTGATLGEPDYDAWCRNIQRYHMDTKRWNDIAYNFLVDPHGIVREGRGWESRNAANRSINGMMRYNNGNTVSVCLLGMGDDTRVFTDAVKLAVRELIDIHSYIHGNGTEARGHRDLDQTACPGDLFYAWVSAGAIVKPGTEDAAVRQFLDAVESGTIVQLTDGQWVWADEAVEVVPGLLVHTSQADRVARDLWILAHPDEEPPASLPAAAPEPSTPIQPVRSFEEELVDVLPQLKIGDEGFHVRRAQALCNLFTVMIKVDGDFGPKTHDAVIRVQHKFELEEDGIVGPATWGVLITAPESRVG
jgi:peptidoglycan hydrolase-like protein with peptidoglycan-binding domain